VFEFNPYEEVDFRGSREIEVVSLIYGKNEGEPDTNACYKDENGICRFSTGRIPKKMINPFQYNSDTWAGREKNV